jgi:four helix bundle protein
MLAMGRGVQRFTSLRAWQACDAYKKAVYRVCVETALARDWKRREQLEGSVCGPPAHIAEGFGLFSPPQFAQYAARARASLMESQNHLLDAVDKAYISEETRTAERARRGRAPGSDRADGIPPVARSLEERAPRPRTPDRHT